MKMRGSRYLTLAVVLSCILGTLAWSQSVSALKGRTVAPKDADIDSSASISSLLAKKGQNDWSSAKGAILDGYVVMAEKDPDGDVVVFLAANAGETSTTKWVIAEVPPAWQKMNAALSENSVRGLLGKHVKVTGWLFYDANDQADPRGTRWEVHPVTQIDVVK
jgi:hypothetical protein